MLLSMSLFPRPMMLLIIYALSTNMRARPSGSVRGWLNWLSLSILAAGSSSFAGVISEEIIKVDPFLHLINDSKLQATCTPNRQMNVYGSKDKEDAASISLSALELTESQSKESMAATIMNFVRELSEDEQSSLRKQLLSEFMPDDICPLGAQIIESPPQIAPFDSKHDYASQEQVMPPLFVIDDDANVEVCERPEDPLLQLNTNSTCLLSINELLETMYL
ncbi:hypothetical protein HPP92_009969 [Vanilla planifolia]|uniref:Uncharacterized protein n=2 Tax=Vanilla planifolia TaxID=51239 RepID=A0A835V308_VANPL|nr:hypothetical protein HPP92_009969 [Vanilla planifolia]